MIWYYQTRTSEEFEELPYIWVRSVEIVREPNRTLMARGVVAGIAGLGLWFMIGLVTSFALLMLGVILILMGAQGKEAYYQLRSDRLSEKELERWRIPFRGSMEFMATIGTMTGKPLTDI